MSSMDCTNRCYDRLAESNPLQMGVRSRDEVDALGRALLARLQQITRRVCHRWPDWDRDDLAQEAALKIINASRKGDGRELSTAYLVCAVKSAVTDELRRRSRRKESAVLDPETEVRANSPDPECIAIVHCLQYIVQSRLAEIADSRRLPVLLRLQGYSIAECATHLGISNKQAENLTYRGLSQLRNHLELGA